MGRMLVVDGSGVCRAPIVAFTLLERFRDTTWTSELGVETRGIDAEAGATMCENAAARLGYAGRAIAFFGSFRAAPLTAQDIASSDIVLTAERAQRSAVVRMRPGTQATVFTWKEALVLASVLLDRRRAGNPTTPVDLPALARALHGARGTVPLIEPPVRTGPFHWRRSTAPDPLTIADGHTGGTDHRRVTQESVEVAAMLGSSLAALMGPLLSETVSDDGRPQAQRLRRPA